MIGFLLIESKLRLNSCCRTYPTSAVSPRWKRPHKHDPLPILLVLSSRHSYRFNPNFMNCSSDSHGFRFHSFDSYVGCSQFDRSTDTRKVFALDATTPFF